MQEKTKKTLYHFLTKNGQPILGHDKTDDSAKINEQTDDKKANRTKWHIWFLPTHKPTLKKPKEPFFCQRSDTVPTEKLILTD